MTEEKYIAGLVQLGEYLQSGDTAWREVKVHAQQHNPWFTAEFIELAVNNICAEFLQYDKLKRWVQLYGEGKIFPKRVGITMAGNIPLVGFHDFMCGYVSGHQLLLKYSGKDNILLPHCIDKLKEWMPELENIIQSAELLKNCDAYIATGSNNSARYFEYYFAKFPHIIRRNRTSVAVLSGSESEDELSLLADDVFQYFGLGCRNVTKIYVPRDYDFLPLLQAFRQYQRLIDHHKYKNNFDYNLALLILNNIPYMSSDNLILTENESIFSPIGVLHYAYYDDKEKLSSDLQQNDDLQCIVAKDHLPFGLSQRPSLTDYADGIDTMQFLRKL